MGNFKPDIPPRRNWLAWYTERCELTLVQIEFIELRSLQLSDDINGFNFMNSSNIVTVTDKLGNEHWLRFWKLQQHRKVQFKKELALNPNKVYKLEDPEIHFSYVEGLSGDSLVLSANRRLMSDDDQLPSQATQEGNVVSRVHFSDEELPKTNTIESHAMASVHFSDEETRPRRLGWADGVKGHERQKVIEEESPLKQSEEVLKQIQTAN